MAVNVYNTSVTTDNLSRSVMCSALIDDVIMVTPWHQHYKLTSVTFMDWVELVCNF